MNTKGSTFVPCSSQWNHATSQGEIAITQPFLTNFGSFWYKWTPKDPLLSQIVLNGITQPLRGNGHNSANSDQFWIFLVQMKAKGSPFVSCGSQWNHPTSQGKMAVTQPFLDPFWIILVKMSTKGFPFVPCNSQWNQATSQGENGHNSVISCPILDLYGTNDHQRLPFCPRGLSMESCNLSRRN